MLLEDSREQQHRDFMQVIQKIIQLYDELLQQKNERINFLQCEVNKLDAELLQLHMTKDNHNTTIPKPPKLR